MVPIWDLHGFRRLKTYFLKFYKDLWVCAALLEFKILPQLKLARSSVLSMYIVVLGLVCVEPGFSLSSLKNSRNFKWQKRCKSLPQFPSAIGWRKKSLSYNHKTTIWVSHDCYLNPAFHKILWRAFWVIAILRFSPYVARVDFKGLISK